MLALITEKMNIWIGRLCVGIMGAMVAVVFCQVVLRYVFSYGLTWAEEIARYFQVWLTFLGACLAFQTLSHVSISLFVDKLPSLLRLIALLIVQFISLAFLVLLIFKGSYLAKFAWSMLSPAMEIPMGIVYLAVPACSVFMCINIIDNSIKIIKNYGKASLFEEDLSSKAE